MSRSKSWCFTLNNWTNDELQSITALASRDEVPYLIFGREIGDNQTPHLQGFIQLSVRQRLPYLRRLIPRAHFEAARGTPKQAADYCKKDNDYDEFGEIQQRQGKRSDWDELRDFVISAGSVPSNRELASNFPALFSRSTRIREICAAFLPTPVLIDGNPREGFQADLYRVIEQECESTRIVRFVVDFVGNKGKSWFCAYALSKLPERVQVLSVGKRDDLAHAIDETKDIFLFDCPRGSMEFLQYSVLEKLKDRMIFSPKYSSTVKILTKLPHVIVFCNEEPDNRKMSHDRYHITIV